MESTWRGGRSFTAIETEFSGMSLDPSVFISLAFLFGIAAQFRAMDGYSFLAGLISSLMRRVGLLYAVVLVAAVFSPFVLNDVVVLILTPVLIRHAKQFERDIAPLVVGEICFVNIASSLTPFGNPQNILLWVASGISVWEFVLGTWQPLLLSGILTVAVLYPFRRAKLGVDEPPVSPGPKMPLFYLIAVGLIVISLDTIGLASVFALGAAFAVGFPLTFRSPKLLVKEFDYRSLLILCLLVVAVAAIASFVQPALAQSAAAAASGSQPYSALFVGLSSNLISNVPATQLVLGIAPVTQHVAPKIAVEAGLAGNITPIGSFANILALTLVRKGGLSIKRTILLQLAVGSVSFLPAFL